MFMHINIIIMKEQINFNSKMYNIVSSYEKKVLQLLTVVDQSDFSNTVPPLLPNQTTTSFSSS